VKATARGKPPPNLARPGGIDQRLLRGSGLRARADRAQAVLASLELDVVLVPDSPELLEEPLSEEEPLSVEDDDVEDDEDEDEDEPRLSVL
jgi:hypothetical protein